MRRGGGGGAGGGGWLWLNLWFLWFYFDLIQFKTIHYNFPLFISFKCLLLSICLLCRKHTLLLYCFAVCWINICTTSAIYFCANKHDLWNFTVLALEYVKSLFIFQSTIVSFQEQLLSKSSIHKMPKYWDLTTFIC